MSEQSKAREVELFEGRYLLTDSGEIFSLFFKNKHTYRRREIPLKLKASLQNGYQAVTLSDRKCYRIHQLVAKYFIGPLPSPKHKVLHNDDNRANNHVSNLRYGTTKDNADDAIKNRKINVGEKSHKAKISEFEYFQIKELLKNGILQKDIAKKYRITQSAVSAIKTGKNWKSLRELGEMNE